jgi:peptidyl-prolyl cis-trans isomerase A (cyclophilin A)
MRPFSVMSLLLAAVPLAAQRPARQIPIVIETSMGRIEAALDSAKAPVTVTNFLRYVDGKLFDHGAFFRAVTPENQPNNNVEIEVIQSRRRSDTGGFAPIPLERTSVTGLHHGDGELSMARGGPNTGSDQFFITIGDQPSLDFGGKRNADGQGFAAFGIVTRGMDVVRKIQRQPANGQTLVAPVTIIAVRRG